MKTQFRKCWLAAAVAVSWAGGVGSAHAQSHSVDLGTSIVGLYQPAITFANLSTANVNGGTLLLDVGSSFGQGAGNRLFGGEDVRWTTTFASVQTALLDDLAASLNLQGFTQGHGGSARYTPASPVPEPGTYVMLLAGLGLIGVIARRRRIQ